jgi:TolB-like protein
VVKMVRKARFQGTVAALALSALMAAAAPPAGAQAPAVPATLPPPLDRVAILPLTNLSGAPDAAQLFETLLVAALAERGPVIESGFVNAVMDSLRIRPTVSPQPADVQRLKSALRVRYLVVGSVLEHGMIQTPDGRFPCSGVVVKVLDVDSTRVTWAGSRFRCGDDKERFFGWGRDFDPVSVARTLTTDLALDVRGVVWPSLREVGRDNE